MSEPVKMYTEFHNLTGQSFQSRPGPAFFCEATGAVPRKVKLSCDRLFLLGNLEEKRQIDAAMVKEIVLDKHRKGSAPARSA